MPPSPAPAAPAPASAPPAAAPPSEPSYTAGTDGFGSGAGDVPTQVPPGGSPQTAPTQQAYVPAPATTPEPAMVPPGGYGAPPQQQGYGYPASPPVAGYQTPPTQWQQPYAATPAPAAPKARTSARTVLAGVLGFICALAFGVASFLPWAEVDSFRGISGAVVTGWDGLTSGIQDGPFFALVAVVAGAIAASMISGRASLLQKLLLLAAGMVGLGMTVYELSEYSSDVDTINRDINDLGHSASLGIGLWLALGACIGIVVAALLAKRTKAEKAPEPGVSPVGQHDPAATVGDPRAVGAVG